MKKRIGIIAAAVALGIVGAASAHALAGQHQINLESGHCKVIRQTKGKVHRLGKRLFRVKGAVIKVKICAVAPSPMGKTFSGNGTETLAPITVPKGGVEVSWTSQPDSYGLNSFSVNDSGFKINFDNGNGATSGKSFVPAGTYTITITATGSWTLSF